MKKILPILLSLIFITSCAGNAATPVPVVSVPTTGPAAATDTSVPLENTVTATYTSEPVVTSTPVPPPARWYWGIQEGTNELLAVNQDGETRQVGSLPRSELENYGAFAVDGERQLLVTEDQSRLHAYLLTLDGMQPIELPSDLTYNREQFGYSLVMPAVLGDHAVLGYTDQESDGGSSSAMADQGPLVFIDLQSLTGSLLDKQVNRDIYSTVNDSRLWAHLSEDGRYLRYLDGDREKMSVRELDMSSGEVRTVNSTTGQVTTNITASLRGDLWRFAKDGLVFDLNGNQAEFTDKALLFRPLRDGKGMLVPVECDDNCEIKVVDPFSAGTELTYTLPWATTYTFPIPLLNIPGPDQSLILVGAPPARLLNAPAILDATPTLMADDRPVFRLTPDGGSRLVGVYTPEFGQDSTPASTDGRYMYLGAVDHESFFIYDVLEDRPLAEMPASSELNYFWGDASFHDTGIITHITASTAENTDRDFFQVYSFLSGKSFYWEGDSGLFAGCVDILPDDSLVCWKYNDEQTSFNLVRYNPAAQETKILLENALFIDDVW